VPIKGAAFLPQAGADQGTSTLPFFKSPLIGISLRHSCRKLMPIKAKEHSHFKFPQAGADQGEIKKWLC
jgi:hypothetical protein